MVGGESCQKRPLGLPEALLLEPDSPDHMALSKGLPNLRDQILLTWEFYPTPILLLNLRELVGIFIKPMLHLIICNYHLP